MSGATADISHEFAGPVTAVRELSAIMIEKNELMFRLASVIGVGSLLTFGALVEAYKLLF